MASGGMVLFVLGDAYFLAQLLCIRRTIIAFHRHNHCIRLKNLALY